MFLTKYDSVLLNSNIDFLNVDYTNVKVASFDLDYTIIKTKSGKKMPESEDDWVLFANKKNMQNKLRTLNKQGYMIVIFSNQSNLEKRITIEKYSQKIEAINNELSDGQNLNISWFFALEKNKYRKPLIGMLDLFLDIYKRYLDTFNIEYKINMSESFYCGDAAGRVYNSSSKDFSYTDMFFAKNAKMRFYTPEQFFLSDTKNYNIVHPYQNLDLKKIFQPSPNKNKQMEQLDSLIESSIINGKKICFIMVGCPGSGKTTIRHYIMKNPLITNDIFVLSGDDKSSIKEYNKAINNKNIIIDSTNPSFDHRNKYYSSLNSDIYDFIVFNLNIDKTICRHLNWVRYNISINKSDEQLIIPEIAYRIYLKKYEDPNLDISKTDISNIQIININNIGDVLDPNMITDEYLFYYDV
jgi:bifunctional polynucleotide phosphatase/kinase